MNKVRSFGINFAFENFVVKSHELAGDPLAGILALDQLATVAPHEFEVGFGEGEERLEGFGSGVGTYLCPPTAMVGFELSPWRAFGGDDGRSAGQCLGDDDAEILAVGGEDKEVCLAVEVELFLSEYGADELDLVGYAEFFGEGL